MNFRWRCASLSAILVLFACTATPQQFSHENSSFSTSLISNKSVSVHRADCSGPKASAIEAPQVTGLTILSLSVTSDGAVKVASVTQSSGSKALDDAAVRCAMLWRFKPGTLNGEAVDASVEYAIQWSFGAPIPSRPGAPR
jgi:TonB family protein